MEIKVQRDTKVILSLSEREARQLAGLLIAANSLDNNELLDIEQALHEAVEGNTADFERDDGGYYRLVK